MRELKSQALALFGLATVGVLDKDRVSRLLSVHLSVMLSVWYPILIIHDDHHHQCTSRSIPRYLQFYQPMVLNSLVVSLIPVAILSLQVGNKTAKE